MNKHFLNIFFITVLTSVYSCSLNDDSPNNNDETIIDYRTFNYVDSWIENKKISGTDTIPLDNVQLSFFYNHNEIPRSGEYRYINSEFSDIDTTGTFIQDIDLLYFIPESDSLRYKSANAFEDLSGEAEVYKYRIENGHLMITDTTASPKSELLYELETN